MSYHNYLAHIRTLFYLKSFFSHVITKPNYWHFTNNETQILIAAKNIKKIDSLQLYKSIQIILTNLQI